MQGGKVYEQNVADNLREADILREIESCKSKNLFWNLDGIYYNLNLFEKFELTEKPEVTKVNPNEKKEPELTLEQRQRIKQPMIDVYSGVYKGD